MLTVRLHTLGKVKACHFKQPSRDWKAPISSLVAIDLYGCEVNGIHVEDPDYELAFNDEVDLVPINQAGITITGWLVIASLLIQAVSIGLQFLLTPRDREATDEESQQYLLRPSTRSAVGVRLPLIFGTTQAGLLITEQQTRTKYYNEFLFNDEDSGATVVFQGDDDAASFRADRTDYVRGDFCIGPTESITNFFINQNRIQDIPQIRASAIYGESDQAVPDEFDDVETVASGISAPVIKASGPVTWTAAVPGVGFIFEIQFPAGLATFDASGVEVLDRTVRIKVEYKQVSDVGWSILIDQYPLTSATRSRNIQRLFRVTGLPLADWQVRVTRLTDDNTGPIDPLIIDDFNFSYMATFTKLSRAYPGRSGATFSRIPHQQIQAVQNAKATIKNHNDIRVYTDTSTYTVEYSDNPAWVCCYFLTDKAHGLGTWYSWDKIDLASAIEWAEWNDQLINNERRNVWGGVIDAGNTAEKTIQGFCAPHDCYMVDEGGYLRFVVDKPRSSVATFTDVDIEAGSLIKERHATRDRATRVTARIKNADNTYALESVTRSVDVIDAGQDILDVTVDLPGVQSVTQAERQIWKQILRNKNTVESISFSTRSPKGLAVQEGDVFTVESEHDGVALATGKLISVDFSTGAIRLSEQVDITGTGVLKLIDNTGSVSSHAMTQSDEGLSEFVTLVSPSSAPYPGQDFVASDSAGGSLYVCDSRSIQPDNSVSLRGSTYDVTTYDPVPDMWPTDIIEVQTPSSFLIPPPVESIYVDYPGGNPTNPTASLQLYVAWEPPRAYVKDGVFDGVQEQSRSTVAGIAPLRSFQVWEWKVWPQQEAIIHYSQKMGQDALGPIALYDAKMLVETTELEVRVSIPGRTITDFEISSGGYLPYYQHIAVLSCGYQGCASILNSPVSTTLLRPGVL